MSRFKSVLSLWIYLLDEVLDVLATFYINIVQSVSLTACHRELHGSPHFHSGL